MRKNREEAREIARLPVRYEREETEDVMPISARTEKLYGYSFVHFIGESESCGERGVRDPYLLRSADGEWEKLSTLESLGLKLTGKDAEGV